MDPCQRCAKAASLCLVMVPGTTAAIARTVTQTYAHLLVMGGFGHSPAYEFVLGGVSRTVLESMTLPVLMFH